MRTKKLAGRFIGGCGGATAAEFALILPIFMLLLFGGIEFGRLIHDYHVVTKGVRDATRYLSRVPVSCPGGVGNGVVDDPNDITKAQNLALTGSTTSGSYNLGYWTNPGTVSVVVDCITNDRGGGAPYEGIYDGMAVVPLLNVTAAVPFTFIVGTLVSFTPTMSLTVSQNETSIGE